MQFKTIIEPFKIKSVEPLKMNTEEERIQNLENAFYNPFYLQSDDVIIDLLTDSGTSAMSAKQWAGVLEGDEAYAGSRSWIKMEKAINTLTGMQYVLPTHQGRAAERILYSHLGGEGKTFISNTHFDTTRANIEFSGAQAFDIPCAESADTLTYAPFKGNMDLQKLEQLIIEKGAKNIGAVVLTVTNNSGGGQPVSMKNAIQVSDICKKHQVLLVLDCCRVAENAFFIQLRGPGFENHSCKAIAQEMFDLCDAAIMSAKKDAMVNMGGFLTLRNKEIADACKNLLIITEGFTTYGGLSGRDMEAIAIGIDEGFDQDYLHYRIRSVEFLAEKLRKSGVPVMWPAGGHAVYIDAKKMYPHLPVNQYPAQALVCELYIKGGIRAVEIGSVMFGKYDDQGNLVPARQELVRLAFPRRVYTQSHIEYVAEVFEHLMKNREEINGYKIVEEPLFLRHFTAKLAPVQVAEIA